MSIKHIFSKIDSIWISLKWNCESSRQMRCSWTIYDMRLHALAADSRSLWSLICKIILRIHSSGNSVNWGWHCGSGWISIWLAIFWIRSIVCEIFQFFVIILTIFEHFSFHLQMRYPQILRSQRFAPALLIFLLHELPQLINKSTQCANVLLAIAHVHCNFLNHLK